MKLRGYLKAVALLAAAAVWPATALAGNPHGTPPGQQKKGSGSADVHANGHTHASGHVNAHVKVHGHVSVGVGVKSSSSTAKNTFAAAGSTQTKLYGNGQTAGQIAMANGAQADTMLFGPGNSQPHKVACGAHWIDVHALKAHAGACAGAHGSMGASARGEAGFSGMLFATGNSGLHKVGCGAHLIDVHALKAHLGACAGANGAAGVSGQSSANAKASLATKSSGGGVLGASATAPRSSSPGAAAVLGTAARSSTLPFTGLSLVLSVAFGLALFAGGLGLRRLARSRA